jgi:hypothetical protein
MGPLFALPLLLVEGDDDYKVWSHAGRYNQIRVAVLPCEGSRISEYVATLERVFQAIVDPSKAPLAFALQDRDDREEQPAASGNFVRRIWLSCREAENLFLTDEVLAALGTTWHSGRLAIRARSNEFGKKADALLAAADAERGTHDFKGVMEELTTILDPAKKVDWRLRVGQVIGRARPSGQLAAFLGDQVLDALWPAQPPAVPDAQQA